MVQSISKHMLAYHHRLLVQILRNDKYIFAIEDFLNQSVSYRGLVPLHLRVMTFITIASSAITCAIEHYLRVIKISLVSKLLMIIVRMRRWILRHNNFLIRGIQCIRWYNWLMLNAILLLYFLMITTDVARVCRLEIRFFTTSTKKMNRNK